MEVIVFVTIIMEQQKSMPSITIAAIAEVIGVVTITLVMTAAAIVVPAVAQQPDNNSSTTIVTPSENTIKVNATEKNEVYRWQINGQTNPDLKLTANTAYTFTVQNPTDTKHELIIADSQGKELATTGDLQPGSSGQLTFKPNMTSSSSDGNSILGYHCEYHPDLMKGSIQIVNQ